MALTMRSHDPPIDPEPDCAPDCSDQRDSSLPNEDPATYALLQQIVGRVQCHAQGWPNVPIVSIGRARDLTNLAETRIRYFEDLGVLQPSKSTPQAGASRLYTFADLRCLDALALLVHEHSYRPAEAARFVIANRNQIINGIPGALVELMRQEGGAITDGFLLARLMSQLIDAAQIELCRCMSGRSAHAAQLPGSQSAQIRVVGVILPMQPLAADSSEPSAQMLHRLVRAMCYPSKNMLVALDRATFLGEDSASIPPAFEQSGRNDTTILFFSPTEPWELPYQAHHRYCVYAPQQHPQRLMVLIVAAPEHLPVPVMLQAPDRRVLFDRILAMCEQIFKAFRPNTLAKNYRYRSDGFPIEQTQATYQELLKTITDLIFPDDPTGMAALLIPNSLDRPATLSVLAQHNYAATLAPRAKLDLHGEGQGLCGRAYNLREPFYSSAAKTDPRVAYAVEEGCHVALAVPFTSTWGIAPFGVLYLASRDPNQTLNSDVAYVALILSNILSEQLGRWWLTRLRKSLDLALHQRMDTMMRWFDGLDQHGPDFTHALDDLQQLWQRIGKSRTPIGDTNLALVLFDIDRYRQNVQIHSTDLVPLAAQMHVRNAIQKIWPVERDYWFKNDHVLVLLHKVDADQALAIARRIANQVRAVPPNIQDAAGKPITLTVSAAIKVMTYQDVRDLDRVGAEQFRAQMTLILDQLMQQTAQSPAHTLHLLTSTGWQRL